MRNVFLLLFCFVVSVSSCKKKQGNILASIREQKAEIDKHIGDYTLKQTDDLISKGTGVISGYFDDDRVTKISTQNFLEDRRTFCDYYFDDGLLIYVVVNDFIYNLPNTYTEEVAIEAGDSVWYDDKLTRLEVDQYYFDDNKLIKWTGPGEKDVPVNIGAFADKEPEILAKALMSLKHFKE